MMVRAAGVLMFVGSMTVLSAQAPAPAASTFEVASVKPVDRFAGRGGGFFPGGRFSMGNETLATLIRIAYDLEHYQVINAGPDWIDSAGFEVNARAAAGLSPTSEQVRVMLQNLLVERFKLVTRRETRDTPTYHLTFARSDQRLGPQLRRSQLDCSPEGRRKATSVLANGRQPCATMMSAGYYAADGVEFSQLINLLALTFGRPVTDRTGLNGRFDWELKWADAPGFDGPSLLAAFEEQLGLKVESSQGVVEVIVIESAEMPTPN